MNKLFQLASLLLIPIQSYAALETYLELPVTNGMTAYPSIEVNLKYDDNIFLADDELVETDDGHIVYPVQSSFITEINPEIVLRGRNGLHNWDVGYRGEYGWYQDSENDGFTDHRITSNLHLEANSKHRFNFGFDLLYLHENRGSGISDGATSGLASVSVDPDEHRDMILRGNYTFGGKTSKGRIVIDGNLLDRSYTNNRERTERFNRKESDIGATFYYRLSPKTSLVFLGNFKDINYDLNEYDRLGSLDSTEQRYEAGVSWKSTAATKIRATIGQTYKDFSSNLRKSSNFTSWEVQGLWSPRTYSRINLLANSRPDESNGTGSYTQNTSFGANWDHDWSIKTSTHLGVNFKNASYHGSLRDDDLISYQAGVDYKFKKALKFGLSYEHTNRDSNIDGFNYKDNLIMLTSKLGL